MMANFEVQEGNDARPNPDGHARAVPGFFRPSECTIIDSGI